MSQSHLLERSTPEAEGIRPDAIDDLVQALDRRRLGVHSLMILRHGRVVAERWWSPYEAGRPHMMFSVSKSFTAMAVGMAQAEDRLSIDEPLLGCFPSYASPAARRNMAGVTVRHLLTMATGHETDTIAVMRALPEEDWVRLFMEVPRVFAPGSHFLYNSGASFVLSALVAARTGHQLLDYLAPRLFEPLGMAPPYWEATERGINLGATGLLLRTEELACFGQLCLQRGRWRDRQLVPSQWVDEATGPRIPTGTEPEDDWAQGYGYQFWRSRHGSYRADGAFGQFALVLADLDVVVAITAGSTDTHQVLGTVWSYLLPGVGHDAPSGAPAERRAPTGADLHGSPPQVRSDALSLPVPEFLSPDPPTAALVQGRCMRLPANSLGVDAVTLRFDDDAIILETHDAAGRSESLPAGRRTWAPGSSEIWPHEALDAVVTASRGGWVDEHTLEVHCQCVETPFRRVWRFCFADGAAPEVRVGLDMGFWAERNEVLAGSWGA